MMEYENYDFNEEEDIPYVELELDIGDTFQLYQSVSFHLKNWPGGHPDEQERLVALKDFLYRLVLEYKFRLPDEDT